MTLHSCCKQLWLPQCLQTYFCPVVCVLCKSDLNLMLRFIIQLFLVWQRSQKEFIQEALVKRWVLRSKCCLWNISRTPFPEKRKTLIIYSFPNGIQAPRPVSDFSSIYLVIILCWFSCCVFFSSQFNGSWSVDAISSSVCPNCS